MLTDLRYSLRNLSRNPGFAFAAILTVALGIGASTAIFSVVYNVALKPLPYADSERLVTIDTRADRMGLSRALVGAANFRDWKEQSTVFEEMTLVRNIYSANLTGDGEPERVAGALITSRLFRTLQVQPMIGRGFTEDEEQIGHDSVVILSNGLWKRRFAGDPNVIGRTVMIDSRPNTVIGVMGPDFKYPGRQFQLWRPLTINPDDYQTRANYAYVGVARLKRGVSVSQAQAELDTISRRLAIQYPATNTGVRGMVMPMLDDAVGGVRSALYALLGAVACLLLIGSANLANLLLARALSRATELQVRVALGAGRRRLIVQSITEVLPIVAGGGILGALIAAWGLDALIPFLPATMPRVEEIHMNAPVFGFTLLTLLLTALVVGILPALHLRRSNLTGALKVSFRGTSSGPGRAKVRDAIVVGQIAVAIVLLIGSGLLVRSYFQLRKVNPGFHSDGVLSVSMAIPRAKYGKDDQVAALCESILQRVRVLPDVTSAGMVNRLPLSGIGQIGAVEAELADGSMSASTPVDWRTATPDYFQTLGIPIVQGRSFSERDTGQTYAATPSTKGVVGIVDEQIARTFWPNENPIGKRFRIAADLPWTEVIGVVGHIQHDRLDQDTRPQVYWNYKQRAQDRMVLVVRTRRDPAAIESAVIAAVHDVDRDQPVYDVRPMTQVIDSAVSQQWLNTLLLGIFAAASVTLTGVGIYGVLSYSVGQRMREFGIRMALGAQRESLMFFVLRHAALLTVIGGAIGVAGSLLLMRMMTTLLFGVSSSDRITFGFSLLVIAAVALLAGLIPARRAANADPMTTLR